MRSFASDNNSGVHPLVMDAICKANADHAIAYGDDKWTREAIAKIKETFEVECEPFLVFNGTGANIISLQLITESYHTIFCAETAHIYVDECASPAKATGCHIRPIATPDGKLTPELILPHIHGVGDQHHSQPRAIYLSQCTELGTIYTLDELKSLSEFAKNHNLLIHMDGARIANACAALGVSFKEMTVDCGVDVLSFGGTKNGLMMGECVVVFRPELFEKTRFVRKQSAQLASKMRYMSCQFTAYLSNNLWLDNATHANKMAYKLFKALESKPEVHFTQKAESNQLFLTMPRKVIDELLKDYFFYFWDEANNEIRLVTSFDTTEDDIAQFIKSLDACFADKA